MSELPQPNPEDLHPVEAKVDPEKTYALFKMIDRMSTLVAPAPDPEPGIQKWFKMDVPWGQYYTARDCNDEEVDAHVFEARLHEQDSAHEVWEFKFSNNMQGRDERHVRGWVVKSKTGVEFLLSPMGFGKEESNISALRLATADQISAYYEETLYHPYSEVRQMAAGYDNIGFDSPDSPGQKKEWDYMVQCWAEDGATVPGLMENGHLIN